jgi:hypothetical protein
VRLDRLELMVLVMDNCVDVDRMSESAGKNEVQSSLTLGRVPN